MADDYRVSVLDRLRDVVLNEADLLVGPEITLVYSWHGGYERFEFHREGEGTLHFSGAYHPNEGFCETYSGADEGVCKWCGRTLM